MPNWCEGNIRFRGKPENIKRFLMNEIVCCRMKDHETVEEKPIIEDKGYCLIITHPENGSWFYIKGTRRNFFDGDSLEIWIDENGNADKEIIVCVDNFKAAWSFQYHDRWLETTKEYNIDVKLTGYDRGMHFSQIKTITRNGRVKDSVREYEDENDWMWNCPEPNNGG